MNISEAIIAGIILSSGRNLPKLIASGITPDLIEDRAEQIIYETILGLHKSLGDYPDEIEIFDKLSPIDCFHSIISEKWNRLTHDEFSDSSFDRYLDQLVVATKRKIDRDAAKMMGMTAGVSDDEFDIIYERSEKLKARKNELGTTNDIAEDEAFANVHKRIDDLLDGKIPKCHYSMNWITGFHDLLGEIHKNELVVVAARPSVGKSSFANKSVLANIGQGRRGVLFNLEMSEEEIIDQMVCIRGKINGRQLAGNTEQLLKYKTTLETVEPLIRSKLSIFTVSDSIEGMYSTLLSDCQKKGNPDFIVVDYIQLISSSKSSTDNRATQVGEVTRTLKKWTTEFDCPVIALAQLSRGMESEARLPVLRDLKDSGSIEQDANRVIMLHRDLKNFCGQSQDELRNQDITLVQRKNRRGATGTMKLSFFREYTDFHAHTGQ